MTECLELKMGPEAMLLDPEQERALPSSGL